MNMILNLTRKCNLRCYRCPVKKSDDTMSWNTIVKALELVKDVQSPSILFYGGEPTIESEMMMATLDEALLGLDNPRN